MSSSILTIPSVINLTDLKIHGVQAACERSPPRSLDPQLREIGALSSRSADVEGRGKQDMADVTQENPGISMEFM